MPFVHQIIPYSSLSVVGLGKNTGKTECLRYIIKRLSEKQKTIAVTSIGIDGESIDRVTATPKPEIHLEKGMYFTTVGAYYLQKRFTAEICHVEENATVLGKMLTARALGQGKLVIAGPTDTLSLQRWVMNTPQRFPVDICLVDGAVSRLSPASPAVTQSMVLATGAAYSAHLKTLVDKTRFVYDILQLPVASRAVKESLEHIAKGIHIIKEDGTVENVGIDSALTAVQIRKVVALGAERLYIPGMLGNALLQAFMEQKGADSTCLYIKDFSHIFAEPRTFYAFLRKGGQIKQLRKVNLLAVCVNPVSPRGYHMRSDELVESMEQALGVPVYDIKKIEA